MQTQLKKYFALFLLVIFVYPFVEKGIHDVTHAKDFHCLSKKAIHFHTKEHHCLICDYIVSKSSDIPERENQLTVFIKSTDRNISVIESDKKISTKFTFSLRGPPLVC